MHDIDMAEKSQDDMLVEALAKAIEITEKEGLMFNTISELTRESNDQDKYKASL